jgi:hypothetical protein
MDEVATMLSFNNLFGHFSYLLIAISYWLTDMFWLRLVAVVGLSFEILYFWHSGGDLRTGIGWDLIFIIINAYQLYRLLRDRLSLRLPEPTARRWPLKMNRSRRSTSFARAASA